MGVISPVQLWVSADSCLTRRARAFKALFLMTGELRCESRRFPPGRSPVRPEIGGFGEIIRLLAGADLRALSTSLASQVVRVAARTRRRVHRGAAGACRADDRRTAVMMITVSPAPTPTRKTAMMPAMCGAASHKRSLPMAIVPPVPAAVRALMV
jgi:hypothetical protein